MVWSMSIKFVIHRFFINVRTDIGRSSTDIDLPRTWLTILGIPVDAWRYLHDISRNGRRWGWSTEKSENKRVLQKCRTETERKRKTEWNGKYAMQYTYSCVKYRWYTIFIWITPLLPWQCRCTIQSPKIVLTFSRVEET